MEDMETFAEMASGAAEASKTQVDMLEQIEVGIEQITMVVQNNSATAQETSAVSEELSAQATSLDEMISKFVLK
jgi:methyl-accepting chemotaxis protein